jgi:hypothetical protein
MGPIEANLSCIYEHILEKDKMDYKDALKCIFELAKIMRGFYDLKPDIQEKKIKLLKDKMQQIGLPQQDIEESIRTIVTKEEYVFDSDDELNKEEANYTLLYRVLGICFNREGAQFNNGNITKLIELFGADVDRETAQINVINYLVKYLDANKEGRIPIHDACQLTVPDKNEKWTPEIWSTLVLKHLNNHDNWEIISSIIASAAIIEANFEKEKKVNPVKIKNLTPQNIRTFQSPYKNKDKNPEAAMIFSQYNVPEEDFDLYLTLKPVDDITMIPEISLKSGEFKLTRLRSNDPRAAILGYLTGCCQSLGREGEDCARYGIENPNGGFYFITNNKDKIVSQFFAWRVGQHLCIDSLESIEYIFDTDAHRGVDVALINEFSSTMCLANHGISAVHVGTGGRTPKALGSMPLVDEATFAPIDFGNGYRDSNKIRTIFMTDNEFLDNQLGVTSKENWLEQAINNVTHVEQFLHLLKIAGNNNIHLFKPALEKQLSSFKVSMAVSMKTKYHNLIMVGIYIKPAVFSQVCVLMECDKMPSEAFNVVCFGLGDDNRKIFIDKYFNFSGVHEWWKAYPNRIRNISELVHCINACETDEQLLNFADFLTGKRFLNEYNNQCKLANITIESDFAIMGDCYPTLALKNANNYFFYLLVKLKHFQMCLFLATMLSIKAMVKLM